MDHIPIAVNDHQQVVDGIAPRLLSIAGITRPDLFAIGSLMNDARYIPFGTKCASLFGISI
jgi:hypothetical protein